MSARLSSFVTIVLLGSTGCYSDDIRSGFGTFAPKRNEVVPTPSKLPQGSAEASSRVDSVGHRILAANPDITIRPAFYTFNVPDLAIHHVGTMQICISEGLVKKCKTDGTTDDELAAIICTELGKMIAESQMQGAVVRAERDPPFAPRVGGDVVGGGSDPDFTLKAEQAMWEKRNPRPRTGAAAFEQNPAELSRRYLTNLNIDPLLLTKVAPLMRLAESNPKYDKSITGTSDASNNGPPRP